MIKPTYLDQRPQADPLMAASTPWQSCSALVHPLPVSPVGEVEIKAIAQNPSQ